MVCPPAYYTTKLDSAHHGDSLDLLRSLEDDSVKRVMTSPPFALHFKKEYGNVDQPDYIPWFCTFAREST